MEATLINLALTLDIAACVIGIAFLLTHANTLFVAVIILATGGFGSTTLAMFQRWTSAGRPPLANIYESLVFFSWAIWFVVLVLRIPRRLKETVVLSLFIATVFLGYACMLDGSIQPLMPALRSNWLLIHVIVIFLGYSGFALAFVAGLGILINLIRNSNSTAWERVSALCMRFGFLFLTYGILTGSVWANEAWAMYWSWDPKEIWALVTWIFYLLYFLVLPSSVAGGWEKRKAACLTAFFSVIGFCVVLFTYFGVTYLLAGLHSYR
jgi:ABC-type transport system involved in cytochrome c biogenesis permease subunit